MILETYYFLSLLLSVILLITGITLRFPPLLLVAGVLMVLPGIMGFSDGVGIPIDYNIERNELDQNRVEAIKSDTLIVFGSLSNETPPAGTLFDAGLWWLSWIFIIFGLSEILFGLTFTIKGGAEMVKGMSGPK